MINFQKKEDYGILQLANGKLNLLNAAFLRCILAELERIKNDDSIKGIILTGQEACFSLGMDVKSTSKLIGDELTKLGALVSQLNYDLVSFPKPLVAAISGHAPAGGTIILNGADYRIMVDDPKYILGLNEIGVGLPLPFDVAQGIIFWLGMSKAYSYLLEGKVMNPKEALKLGLLNELCTKEDLIPKAEKQLKKYMKTNKDIFSRTKLALRGNWIAILEEEMKKLEEEYGEFWQRPEILQSIKDFANRL